MNKQTLFFTSLAAIIITAIAYALITIVGKADLLSYYLYRLQGNLFSASLILGGIYLFIRFFLIIQIKQTVFKNQKEVKALLAFDRSLNGNVIAFFTAALIQFVLGLLPYTITILFSLFAFSFALLFALGSLITLQKTKNAWSQYLKS